MPKKSIVSALVAATVSFSALTAAQAQQSVPLLPLERDFRNGSPFLQRVAVVLGLGAYAHTDDLRNARNDAEAMAGMLRENGFRVLEGYDLDKQGIERLLRKAVTAGGPGSEIVVFYAGHGLQIEDRNYLLPTDARLDDPDDVPFQTLSVESVLATLDGRSRSQVVLLDACRNNPFEGRSAVGNIRGRGASIERGFSLIDPPQDTLLAFSTSPGTLALDGDGQNSPYTQALLGAARIDPRAKFDEILTAVASFVENATGGQQRPVFRSELSSDFRLRPATPAPVPARTGAAQGHADVAIPGATGDIVVPRERAIAIGSRMLQRLALNGSSVLMGPAPEGMSYGLATSAGTIADLSGAPVPFEQMDALVLRIDDVSAKPETLAPVTGIINVPLTFDRIDPGGYRTPRALTLSIVPDPCDVEAGDWFDPQGTGIHRLNAAIRAETAIPACQAAMQRNPGAPRFRFQLGRALKAGGQDTEALSAFRQAAQAGYIRAWREIGVILREQGDLAGAEAALLRGQQEGDPRASAVLGSLRLDSARTEQELDAAYELLVEGIDLGLWTSMEALAGHFETRSNEPARAARFQREADARRDGVDASTVR